MGRAAAGPSGNDAGASAESEALKALQLDRGSAYRIGGGSGRWQAARRDGTGCVLPRASADGLAMALRISHCRPR